MLVTGCSSTSSSHSTSRFADPVVTFTAVQMITPKLGWGLTSQGFVCRTVDGGRQWKGTSLSGEAHSNEVLDAISPLETWLLNGNFLFHTNDGGKEWIARRLPMTQFDPPQLQFLNSDYGWVSASQGGATGTEPLTLYRTVDGGSTWKSVLRVSATSNSVIPLQGAKSFTFRSSQYGWITGDNSLQNGDLYLFYTQDGGAKWRRQVPLHEHLPKDSLLQTGTPSFDGKRGLLPVTWTPTTPQSNRGTFAMVVLETHDGGSTWMAGSHTLTLPLVSSSPIMSTWDAQYIWIMMGPRDLWESIDGGHTWASIRTRGLPGGIENIDFVNGRDGFAWGGTQHELWMTQNGGRSWVSIHPYLDLQRNVRASFSS